VRRAVAYALNRSDIIAAAGGYASPLYTFIPSQALQTVASPSQVSTLLGSLNLYHFDLAKARQEMAQSAYPQGVSATIDAWAGQGENQTQVVAAELGKIGINAHVKVVPDSVAQVEANGPANRRPTTAWEGGCIDPDVSGYDFYLGTANTKPGEW